MARIRSIKPELLEDEKTARLNHLEWRLFVSCLLLADDYGNFRAAPGRVAGAALWAHAIPREDIANALDTLARVSLISLYQIDGQEYAHVVGWEKHQKVDHKGKPACPPQPIAKPSRDLRDNVGEPRETLAPDLDLIGEERIGGEEPASSVPGKFWTATEWQRKFSVLWCEKYGRVAMGGGLAATKATGQLSDQLAEMPEADRLAAQARSSAMFADYLGSEKPDLVEARHPWAWFVTRFDGLRVPRLSVSPQRPHGSPPPKPLPPSAPDLRR